MEKSLSNVSRKFKPISDNSWIFKEHSLEKFSMGKSKNSIKCNQNIDCNYDKENKNATEQKILNKLNRYSSNCFLSPVEMSSLLMFVAVAMVAPNLLPALGDAAVRDGGGGWM